jgi:hypothetical protein
MEVSQTSLELEASSGVFREGRLRLRCLATVFTLYRRSQELELTEDTPQLAPVMGPTAPHSLGTVQSVPSPPYCIQVFKMRLTHSLKDRCTSQLNPTLRVIIIEFNYKWSFTRWQWYYNKTQHKSTHITHHAETQHSTQSYTNTQ